MTAAAAFDAVATEYDAARRRLMPCFDGLYGTVLELIAEWGPPRGARVLDLGAGTGLLAAMVRAARSRAPRSFRTRLVFSNSATEPRIWRTIRAVGVSSVK